MRNCSTNWAGNLVDSFLDNRSQFYGEISGGKPIEIRPVGNRSFLVSGFHLCDDTHQVLITAAEPPVLYVSNSTYWPHYYYFFFLVFDVTVTFAETPQISRGTVIKWAS